VNKNFYIIPLEIDYNYSLIRRNTSMPSIYVNKKAQDTITCVICNKVTERGSMYIERITDGKVEPICHFCYYKLKKENKL